MSNTHSEEFVRALEFVGSVCVHTVCAYGVLE